MRKSSEGTNGRSGGRGKGRQQAGTFRTAGADCRDEERRACPLASFQLPSDFGAKKRGAHIYAELSGYGATADANHITAPAPDGDGPVRCMQMAIESAGLNRENIQYINAHGTSTPINDPLETMSIKKAFGEHAHKLTISSTKSAIGHLLGATGAVEAIATIKAIEHQVAPPTLNLDEPAPECDLDYIPKEPRQMRIDNAISNSLGFGGTNATITLSKFTG